MAEHQRLTAVPLTDVRIEDAFWAPRQKVTRDKTLPHNFKMCEETGRIGNFVKAAGKMEGGFEGYFFNDSDVYKALEGAAYALAGDSDPELMKYVDELIAKIAAAQQSDGYLNSYYILTNEPRWSNLAHKHELYCAGHLIEAAVAHYQATGKRALLDVAVRFADLIDSLFGPDKRHDVPGHEEIELALVKLARVTGEQRYLKLAEFFLEQRGRAAGRELYGDYCQDHLPVREQSEIVGHAVRAMYLYSGVADVAALTGDQGYIDAMDRIWNDVVRRKMYITGGIGPSAHNEGFTVPYDLPNDTAYAETCASIGMILWNHRLNLLHGDARYADVLEQVLYNGFLSGVSLDGEKFFYTNPLGSKGNHHRRPWYSCACCPPNVLRLLLSLGRYVYAHSDDAVYVNLYVGSSAKIPVGGTTVTLRQETQYPWDGKVRIVVDPAENAEFAICLRIPGWSRYATTGLDDGRAPARTILQDGYARIQRKWKRGDVANLDLPMPIRRITANPRVKENVGKVALQRGPIVYCLEGTDNGGRVRHLTLPRNAELHAEHRPDLLGGVTVIRGTVLATGGEGWDDDLYRHAAEAESAEFVAVPYYAWDNREAGEMVVWLPESPLLLEPPPVRWVTASASRCWQSDTLLALHNRQEPKSSNDHGIPRFTWWPRRGSLEWVQYDFDRARRVSSVEVYWFDDEAAGGGCRVPTSWRLLRRDGESWREVQGAADYGAELDQFNRVSFTPVETTGLKIEVQLQEEYSGGILEWRVGRE